MTVLTTVQVAPSGAAETSPIAMDTAESKIVSAMMLTLAQVQAGNVRDACIVAAMIHRHPEIARRLASAHQYEKLLSQVLFSRDVELVVCIAEELVIGRYLAKDAMDLRKRFK